MGRVWARRRPARQAAEAARAAPEASRWWKEPSERLSPPAAPACLPPVSMVFPAGMVPVPAQVRGVHRHRHHVTHAPGDLAIATGTEIGLASLVGLDRPHLHLLVVRPAVGTRTHASDCRPAPPVLLDYPAHESLLMFRSCPPHTETGCLADGSRRRHYRRTGHSGGCPGPCRCQPVGRKQRARAGDPYRRPGPHARTDAGADFHHVAVPGA
jgi:hypothetical protein